MTSAKRSRLVPLVIAATLILLAQACSSQTSPPEAIDEPIHLTASVLPFLSFSPYHIAQEEGYFTEQGLDVEFVRFERGGDAITALIQGDLDIWGGAPTATILNAAQEARVQIVADKGYLAPGGCGFIAFLARPELLESGVLTGPEDLAGLRVVQDRPGGVRDYALQELLAQGGLTLDDVEVVSLPDEAVVDAFLDGSIDVASLGEPGATLSIQSGGAAMWLPAEQALPGLQTGVVAFGERLLDEEPEVGQRFMNAYLKAIRRYNEGLTERNLDILTEATGLERSLLQEVCWPAFRDDGQISVDALVQFQDWAIANDLMENSIPASEFWNPTFVEQATQELDGSQ